MQRPYESSFETCINVTRVGSVGRELIVKDHHNGRSRPGTCTPVGSLAAWHHTHTMCALYKCRTPHVQARALCIVQRWAFNVAIGDDEAHPVEGGGLPPPSRTAAPAQAPR